MRVSIDRLRCNSSGFCERIAPSVFRLPVEGPSQVLVAEPAADQTDAIREAAQMCPMHAILVEET